MRDADMASVFSRKDVLYADGTGFALSVAATDQGEYTSTVTFDDAAGPMTCQERKCRGL